MRGGVCPIIISLMIPPPTPVVRPSIVIPMRSMPFSSPRVAPEMAKAMVPIISSAKTIFSRLYNDDNVLLLRAYAVKASSIYLEKHIPLHDFPVHAAFPSSVSK